MQDGQPGWVFKPGGNQTPEDGQSPQPENNSDQVAPSVDMSSAFSSSQAAAPSDNGAHVEWTASEYIANPKNAGWFLLLGLGSVLLAVAVFLITSGDIVSTVAVTIVGILFGIFAARQPRTLTYAIDSRGLQVGNKFYPYENFKSFSVSRESALSYISLLPLKRFMPPLTIHYAPDDEDRIANTLAGYLPYEDHHGDMMDRIAKKIRF